MIRRFFAAVVAGTALLAFPPSSAAQGTPLKDVTPFLLDRNEEIDLARSAAPNHLGDDATIWILTATGYEKAATGTNGFACFVGRGWSGPIQIGSGSNRRLHPDLFDPKLHAPHCFNPAAARTVLPWHFERTRLLLAGVPAEEVNGRILREIEAGRLHLPEPGAMAYMMSPRQDLGPDFGPWRPHVMVYLPNIANADWGIAGFTHDYPFIAEPGTPWSVAVLPMRRYSDGSWAPEEVTGRRDDG
jgi:hypothetical protein